MKYDKQILAGLGRLRKTLIDLSETEEALIARQAMSEDAIMLMAISHAQAKMSEELAAKEYRKMSGKPLTLHDQFGTGAL